MVTDGESENLACHAHPPRSFDNAVGYPWSSSTQQRWGDQTDTHNFHRFPLCSTPRNPGGLGAEAILHGGRDSMTRFTNTDTNQRPTISVASSQGSLGTHWENGIMIHPSDRM